MVNETGPWREAKNQLSLQFRDKMNVSEIAKKIGRSRGWVKRRLKLYFEFHDVLTKLNLHSLAKLKEYAHALVMDSRNIVPDRMRKRQGRGNKGGASAIERVR